MFVLFLFLAIVGYYSWTRLAIDAYPDIADTTVQVVTQVPGLAAEEIEQQISIPIERAMNGLPGLNVMRSKNTFGLSTVVLVFDDGIEDYWARQRVQERLVDVELPYNAVPGLNPLTSPTGEIFRYVVESDRLDLRELTDLHKWVIIPRLKQVTGVADVSNYGGITTQYQIEVNPYKMEQYDITLGDITEKIEKNNVNAGGSMLSRGDLSYVIRGIGLVKDLEDLGHIVIKTVNGVPVYLNDIGKLKYGNLERKGVLGFTDDTRDYSDGVEGIVQMLRGENPSRVLDDVHKAVDELNNETLPEGTRIHPFMDRTDLVNTTLHTVSHTLFEGMVLVVLVLILFLGSWRGALLVVLTIPLSLLIAFILMHVTNIPANLLSLGAIDFGILVDGAIVMMETVLKKRERHPDEVLTEDSILRRTTEVARPIFFSTLIIITAYLPLFAFEHIEKKLFTPMAYTVGYALLGALCVALFLIPGLAFYAYRKPGKIYHNRWLEKLSTAYHSQIVRLMEKPRRVIVPLLAILLGAGILSYTVGKDFLPPLDEGAIWIQVQLPPGISIEKSKEMGAELRKTLKEFKEVSYVMTQVGRDDEGAEAFVAAVARQLVGDGREPESQRNVAVGKDAHALKGQGESAVQAAFRASGGVQVAFAPGDQETQRAFHADDAARSLLAEIVADGLGDGGAVVEGHVRSPEPREGMGEAARRGVPDEKAHEFVPHGIRQAGANPRVRGFGMGNEPRAEERFKKGGDGLLRFSRQHGEFLRQEWASGGVQGDGEDGLGKIQRAGHGYLQRPGRAARPYAVYGAW